MRRPVGIFDSGVGGTSIWKEIRKKLPFEDTVYLADSKNAPYGTKPESEILRLSIKNTELLLAQGCKLIVVACNTATTNAITHLRENYDVPFIGIEPAIKPAALHTKTKKVGVLATKGTLASSLFGNTSKLHAEGITVMEQEGSGLVELIEAGKAQSEETETLLKTYLEPMLAANMDSLVLGCTHYPYLIPSLKKILPLEIQIIDSGEAVARQTEAILKQYNLLATSTVEKGKSIFYSNTGTDVLQSFVKDYKALVEYLDF
ncbi:glutamate racemase [Flagellimonas sp.]|uniref:glutamate racemase n=1 Tax=Flagellimonas sp. TaxID=2058762 RepID=UPI003F4A7AB9